MEPFTPQDVIRAYQCGLFPMADSRDAALFHWYDPPLRGQLSITGLRIPSRLRRDVLKFPYDIRINTAFEAVIDGCAAPGKGRPQTWINSGIRNMFLDLHEEGYAHSVEAWETGGEGHDILVGGLYGLAIGGAFMGESMFSRAPNASKIALVHLCARLWKGGFSLLDTQFTNAHLEQFGVYEVPRNAYLRELHRALQVNGDFLLQGTRKDTTDEPALVRHYLATRALTA